MRLTTRKCTVAFADSKSPSQAAHSTVSDQFNRCLLIQYAVLNDSVANKKYPDETVHMRSPILAFAVHICPKWRDSKL